MEVMSIREWFATYRERRDAAAVEREAAKANQTPEEQAITQGDPAALAADVEASRASGQTAADATDIADE